MSINYKRYLTFLHVELFLLRSIFSLSRKHEFKLETPQPLSHKASTYDLWKEKSNLMSVIKLSILHA